MIPRKRTRGSIIVPFSLSARYGKDAVNSRSVATQLLAPQVKGRNVERNSTSFCIHYGVKFLSLVLLLLNLLLLFCFYFFPLEPPKYFFMYFPMLQNYPLILFCVSFILQKHTQIFIYVFSMIQKHTRILCYVLFMFQKHRGVLIDIFLHILVAVKYFDLCIFSCSVKTHIFCFIYLFHVYGTFF